MSQQRHLPPLTAASTARGSYILGGGGGSAAGTSATASPSAQHQQPPHSARAPRNASLINKVFGYQQTVAPTPHPPPPPHLPPIGAPTTTTTKTETQAQTQTQQPESINDILVRAIALARKIRTQDKDTHAADVGADDADLTKKLLGALESELGVSTSKSKQQADTPSSSITLTPTTPPTTTPTTTPGTAPATAATAAANRRMIRFGNDHSVSSLDEATLNPFVSKLALEALTSDSNNSDAGAGTGSANGMDRTRIESAAVMFVDISGYSKITAALSKDGPFAISSAVNGYLSKILEVAVGKYRGDVVSFAGDAILLVWRARPVIGGGGGAAAAAAAGDVLAANQQQQQQQQQLSETALAEKRRHNLSAATTKVALCALELQTSAATREYEVDALPPSAPLRAFRMHIAVAAGDVTSSIYVNSAAAVAASSTSTQQQQQAFHVMSGQTMLEIAELVDLAQSGEVAVSSRALGLLEEQQRLLREVAAKQKIKKQQQQQQQENNKSSASPTKPQPAAALIIETAQLSTERFANAAEPGAPRLLTKLAVQKSALSSSSSSKKNNNKNASPKSFHSDASNDSGSIDATSALTSAELTDVTTSPSVSAELTPSTAPVEDLQTQPSQFSSSDGSTLVTTMSSNASHFGSHLLIGDELGSSLLSTGTAPAAAAAIESLAAEQQDDGELQSEGDDEEEEYPDEGEEGDDDDDDDDDEQEDLFDDIVAEGQQRIRQDQLVHPAVIRKVKLSPTATQIAELRFICVLFIYRRRPSEVTVADRRDDDAASTTAASAFASPDSRGLSFGQADFVAETHRGSHDDHNHDHDQNETERVFSANWISEVLEVLDAHQAAALQIIDDDKGLHVVAGIGIHRADQSSASHGISVARELQTRRVPCAIGMACGNTFVGVVGHARLGCRFDIAGATPVRAARLMQHAIQNEELFLVCDSSIAERAEDNSVLAEIGEITVKGSSEPVTLFTHTSFDPHILDAVIAPKVGCMHVNERAQRRIVSFVTAWDGVANAGAGAGAVSAATTAATTTTTATATSRRRASMRHLVGGASFRRPRGDAPQQQQQQQQHQQQQQQRTTAAHHPVAAVVVHGAVGSGKATTIVNALAAYSESRCGFTAALESGDIGRIRCARGDLQRTAFVKTVLQCSETKSRTKLELAYFVANLVGDAWPHLGLTAEAAELERALTQRHVLRAMTLCAEMLHTLIFQRGLRLAIIVRKANYLDESSWALIKYLLNFQGGGSGGGGGGGSGGGGSGGGGGNSSASTDPSPMPTPRHGGNSSATTGRLLFFFTVTPTFQTCTWREIARRLPPSKSLTVGLERMTNAEVAALIHHEVGWRPLPSFTVLVAEKSSGILQCAATLIRSLMQSRDKFRKMTTAPPPASSPHSSPVGVGGDNDASTCCGSENEFRNIVLQIDKHGCFLSERCSHAFDAVVWSDLDPTLAAKYLGEYDALSVQLQLILRVIAEATSHRVWGVSRDTLIEAVCVMQRRSRTTANTQEVCRDLQMLAELMLIQNVEGKGAPPPSSRMSSAAVCSPQLQQQQQEHQFAFEQDPDSAPDWYELRQFYIGNPALHAVLLSLTPPQQRIDISKALLRYFEPVIPCSVYKPLVTGWYLARADQFEESEAMLREAWKGWLWLQENWRIATGVTDADSEEEVAAKHDAINVSLRRYIRTFSSLFEHTFPEFYRKKLRDGKCCGMSSSSSSSATTAPTHPDWFAYDPATPQTCPLFSNVIRKVLLPLTRVQLPIATGMLGPKLSLLASHIAQITFQVRNNEAPDEKLLNQAIINSVFTAFAIEQILAVLLETSNAAYAQRIVAPIRDISKRMLLARGIVFSPTMRVAGDGGEDDGALSDIVFGVVGAMVNKKFGSAAAAATSVRDDGVLPNPMVATSLDEQAECSKTIRVAVAQYRQQKQQPQQQEQQEQQEQQNQIRDADFWVALSRDFLAFVTGPGFAELSVECERRFGGGGGGDGDGDALCGRPLAPQYPVMADSEMRASFTRAYRACHDTLVASEESVGIAAKRRRRDSISSNQNDDAPCRCEMESFRKHCILKGLVPLASLEGLVRATGFDAAMLHDVLLKRGTQSAEAFTAMMYVSLSLSMPVSVTMRVFV